MRSFFLLLLGFVASLGLTGCGSGTISVSGKVTYQTKPVVFGTVVLVDSAGFPRSGTIQPDGSFTIADVKPGPITVAVTSPPPPGASTAKAGKKVGRDADDERTPAETPAVTNPEVVKNWFPLPQKFGYPDESGIKLTVTVGTPLVIELK